MIIMRINSAVLLIVIQWLAVISGDSTSTLPNEPCVVVDAIPSHVFYPNYELRPQITATYRRSILCENIDSVSFDFRPMFRNLSTLFKTDDNRTHFDAFVLHNSCVRHLPKHMFQGLTISGIALHNNPDLSSIDLEAFIGTETHLEVFQTLKTNFSDDSEIFDVLKTLPNLRMVSMHDDQLHSIPDHAFNHTKLTDIWLGLEMGQTSQPIHHIGQYAFYRTPQLRTLRLFSSHLDKIGKHALAQSHRSPIGVDDLQRMLYIYIGSPMLKSASFEETSLSRFRSRAVFLRLFNTSITYLDESLFQPFLETHPSSLLDVKYAPISETCDCRSAWIYRDYCRGWEDSRVYGTSCCTLNLNFNCTLFL